MIHKTRMDSSVQKRVLQENELSSKACPELKHDNSFCCCCLAFFFFFFLITEAGYDEINDVKD